MTGSFFPPASSSPNSKFLPMTFQVTRLPSQNCDFECLFILALKKMVSSVTFVKDHGDLIKNQTWPLNSDDPVDSWVLEGTQARQLAVGCWHCPLVSPHCGAAE